MQPASGDQPVGVIGLGLLGAALAERLVSHGYDVRVWNRSRDKADPLLALGARWADNPLADCRRSVICLYTSDIVEQVLRKMEGGLREGSTLIDCTTGDPDQTAALGARLADRGVDYLESPIAASSEQTRQGQAMALVAGPRPAFDASADLFDALTAQAHYVGEWGSAAKMKLVNNLILGLNRAVLAEGLVFAERLSLDPKTALAVLRQGNAYSGVMDTKGAKMVDGDFSTQAKLTQHAKDVRLIVDQAGRQGLTLPLTATHLALLELGERLGMSEQDNSIIIRAIEHAADQHESTIR